MAEFTATEVSINRSTTEPGGCECLNCYCTFIGGPDHDLCGICYAVKHLGPQVERRENRKAPSRAADRAHLKELASKHSHECRVFGTGSEVRNAWAAYCAAVDNLLGDE